MEDPSSPLAKKSNEKPSWCVCGECQEMATMVENVCCGCTETCLSKWAEFEMLILEPMVLRVANGYRNDFYGIDENEHLEDDNKNFRFGAYRQLIMWRSGYLGAGNRSHPKLLCVENSPQMPQSYRSVYGI